MPNINEFKDLLSLDKWGHLLTDENMATNIPDVYAVGDVRTSWNSGAE